MFGNVGWRGKIYSQGMVNKYCSPQQEGPKSFTSGRGECVYVCMQARACMHAQLYEALILLVCVHNEQQSLFHLLEALQENDQIGRAAEVPLFRRISVALSVILLYLIYILKEEGQTGSRGTRSRRGGGVTSRGAGTEKGSDHEKTGEQQCLLGTGVWEKKADEEGRWDKE